MPPPTPMMTPPHPPLPPLPLSSRLRASLPNVVLVMADDQGWGDVGFNFPNSRDTPFLDSLSLSSFVGLDHHSGASVCSPSRAALLTGRLAPRTGVWRNFDLVALGGLPTNETILAEYFKQRDYQTGMYIYIIAPLTPLSTSTPDFPPLSPSFSSSLFMHRHPRQVAPRHQAALPPVVPGLR